MSGSVPTFELDTIPLAFEVPCGASSTAQVRIRLSAEIDATLDEPPTASVTLPGSVPCGSSVSLTGTFADADADLDEVRWWVDDTLLATSVTSVTVTEERTIRVVARDARGGSTTASKLVGCY